MLRIKNERKLNLNTLFSDAVNWQDYTVSGIYECMITDRWWNDSDKGN